MENLKYSFIFHPLFLFLMYCGQGLAKLQVGQAITARKIDRQGGQEGFTLDFHYSTTCEVNH